MKQLLVAYMQRLMAEDESVYLLTGDLGYMAFEEIAKAFPGRFINVGVAEQNMIGVAGGLARCGKRVFCYSMVPFLTMRCLEQIRLHLGTAALPITLLGVGAGFGYGVQGSSHHGVEDLAVMLSIAGIEVFSPATEKELHYCLSSLAESRKPAFLRLAVLPRESVPEPLVTRCGVATYRFGTGVGRRVALFSTGSLLENALKAASVVACDGVTIEIHSVARLRSFPREYVPSLLADRPFVFTLELQHLEFSALGSLLAELILEAGLAVSGFYRFGIGEPYSKVAGSSHYLEARNGLDVESLVRRLRSTIGVELAEAM